MAFKTSDPGASELSRDLPQVPVLFRRLRCEKGAASRQPVAHLSGARAARPAHGPRPVRLARGERSAVRFAAGTTANGTPARRMDSAYDPSSQIPSRCTLRKHLRTSPCRASGSPVATRPTRPEVVVGRPLQRATSNAVHGRALESPSHASPPATSHHHNAYAKREHVPKATTRICFALAGVSAYTCCCSRSWVERRGLDETDTARPAKLAAYGSPRALRRPDRVCAIYCFV